jgi:hypothetical protein
LWNADQRRYRVQFAFLYAALGLFFGLYAAHYFRGFSIGWTAARGSPESFYALGGRMVLRLGETPGRVTSSVKIPPRSFRARFRPAQRFATLRKLRHAPD